MPKTCTQMHAELLINQPCHNNDSPINLYVIQNKRRTLISQWHRRLYVVFSSLT